MAVRRGIRSPKREKSEHTKPPWRWAVEMGGEEREVQVERKAERKRGCNDWMGSGLWEGRVSDGHSAGDSRKQRDVEPDAEEDGLVVHWCTVH